MEKVIQLGFDELLLVRLQIRETQKNIREKLKNKKKLNDTNQLLTKKGQQTQRIVKISFVASNKI